MRLAMHGQDVVMVAFGQKALAETVGIHLTQLSRYESGASQPILDVIRRESFLSP